MTYATTTAFGLGAVLDVLLGDPPWLPHPIRAIGLLIQTLERLLRKLPYEKIAGCILVCCVLLVVITTVTATLHWGGFLAAAYWIFTCLAVRSLDQESNKVIQALRSGDLPRARRELSAALDVRYDPNVASVLARVLAQIAGAKESSAR